MFTVIPEVGSPDHVLGMDREGKGKTFCKTFRHPLGYPVNSLLNRTFQTFREGVYDGLGVHRRWSLERSG